MEYRIEEVIEEGNVQVNYILLFFIKIKQNLRTKGTQLRRCCKQRKDTLAKWVPEIASRAGIEGHWTGHCLRVTAVTILAENEVPDNRIQDRTGHILPETVNRYKRARLELLELDSNFLVPTSQGENVSQEDMQEKLQETLQEDYENEIPTRKRPNLWQDLNEDAPVVLQNCTINGGIHITIKKN